MPGGRPPAGCVPPRGRVAALAYRQAVVSGPDGRRGHARERRRREPVRRSAMLPVRVSDAERERLRARAQEVGVTMSRLMVESALAKVETTAERERVLVKLYRFERLLGNLANNVNQLAHQANIAGQVVAVERVTGYLDQLLEMRGQLQDLVDELR